jgi:hypothetical protein
VHWSGLNAITTWTSGSNYSDFQDLPDGGNVKGVVGGEFGVILQDSAIRRMVFQPGADIIFSIDRIAKDIGVSIAHSIVDAAGEVFFHSTKGFMKLSPGGTLTPIGKERVDRTFASTYDTASMRLVIGAANPASHVILWTYKTTDFTSTHFNKVLAYDYVLNRWTPIELEGQFLVSLARPGITLESLDTIGSVAVTGAADNGSGLIRLEVASTSGWTTGDIKVVANVGGTTEANGTWTITVIDGTHIDLQGSTFVNAYTSGGYVAGSLDDLPFSLDDVESSTLSQLSAVDGDGKVGFFTGDNLEATLETAEQSGIRKRLWVGELWPITDSSDCHGSVGRRENLA